MLNRDKYLTTIVVSKRVKRERLERGSQKMLPLSLPRLLPHQLQRRIPFRLQLLPLLLPSPLWLPLQLPLQFPLLLPSLLQLPLRLPSLEKCQGFSKLGRALSIHRWDPKTFPLQYLYCFALRCGETTSLQSAFSLLLKRIRSIFCFVVCYKHCFFFMVIDLLQCIVISAQISRTLSVTFSPKTLSQVV